MGPGWAEDPAVIWVVVALIVGVYGTAIVVGFVAAAVDRRRQTGGHGCLIAFFGYFVLMGGVNLVLGVTGGHLWMTVIGAATLAVSVIVIYRLARSSGRTPDG